MNFAVTAMILFKIIPWKSIKIFPIIPLILYMIFYISIKITFSIIPFIF